MNLGIATANREGLVSAVKAFEANPYDGHTLDQTVSQAVDIGGITLERIYVDKGFRSHDYNGPAIAHRYQTRKIR